MRLNAVALSGSLIQQAKKGESIEVNPILLSFVLFFSAVAMAQSQPVGTSPTAPVSLQVTQVAPVRLEQRGNVCFVDFGRDAYGSLQIKGPSKLPPGQLKVRLGEKLDATGAIDRKPGGSVNYREASLVRQAGQRNYALQLPPQKFPAGNTSRTIPGVGEMTPFRYAEIEGLPQPADKSDITQSFVHAPFDDNASDFSCSDETLNAVWALCKHTMKATTAFGIYIDGNRERTPYEADAYINQLSHYACDLDPRVARFTFAYLLAHPTWPTEWSFHMPMMAAEDYLATGDLQLARNHYDALKKKLMLSRTREDGLLRASAIVDWPAAERDGYNDGIIDPNQPKQAGPQINTVANAFYFHALQQMALLARALGKENDASVFAGKAKQVRDSFNQVFFERSRGMYTDGEGSVHASLHANMFPLVFGLVPEEQKAKVADFVQSRGMACSVYGAQYLLEALFGSGKDNYAMQLMTAKTGRSWWHMLELGSTMTLEAWDATFKPNLTWNHAWGAAPANIISRFVLGVRPLEPGYARILIAPQPGDLKWARGKVPTAVGPVKVAVENVASFKIQVEIPSGAKARIVLPRRPEGKIILDGKSISATSAGESLFVEDIGAGQHVLTSY